jgi:hypothetical protein
MDILAALKKEESQLLKHLNTRRVRKRVIQEYKTSGGRKNEITVAANKKSKPS